MNEDEIVQPKPDAPPDGYGETLLYDFAKFLTTLSLLAIGGILTISQTADRADVKPFNVIAAVVTISLATIISATVAYGIAQARAEGRTPSAKLSRYLVPVFALLGMGMGMFLYMWADSLV